MSYKESIFPKFMNGGIDVPIEKYDKLCSCVFYWSYVKPRNCDGCDKIFCVDHRKDHMCFREKNIVSSPILSESMPGISEVVWINEIR